MQEQPQKLDICEIFFRSCSRWAPNRPLHRSNAMVNHCALIFVLQVMTVEQVELIAFKRMGKINRGAYDLLS